MNANDKNTTIVNADIATQATRITKENEHSKLMAMARNDHPVYAFLYKDERHCEVWGLSQLQETQMNFKTAKGKERHDVIVGKLSTALMTSYVNKKGETQRGAIKPIAFWYIKATQEIGCFNGATEEDREYVALYVSGLMKKYNAGLAMIEKGEYSAVKGFDSRKAVFDKNKAKTAMGKFMSAYMGKKDPTQDEIDRTADKTAESVKSVTPVNMD